MITASLLPDSAEPLTFAVSADDCHLHFEPSQWTAKQRADDQQNKDLIAMLQVGTLAFGSPPHHSYLYDAFGDALWQPVLARYHRWFERVGLEPIAFEHLRYAPRDHFYAPITALPPAQRPERVAVYLVSGSNRRLHASPADLPRSQIANSKMTLARDAAEFDLPVPESLIRRHAELHDGALAEFIARHGGRVMLKVMGLAGARNVTVIDSVAAAATYLEEYPGDLEVLFQARLDTTEYVEMTVDLSISDDTIELGQPRQILFAEGLWVGNLLSERFSLTDDQQAVLQKAGAYARQIGYSNPRALNCGLDFFVHRRTGAIVLVEINARYTGGMMPAAVFETLGTAARDAVVCFASVSRQRFDDYLAFIDEHLWPGVSPATGFSALSLGFSPYTQATPDGEQVFVWQMVFGDVAAFNRAAQEKLGTADLVVTRHIEAALEAL